MVICSTTITIVIIRVICHYYYYYYYYYYSLYYYCYYYYSSLLVGLRRSRARRACLAFRRHRTVGASTFRIIYERGILYYSTPREESFTILLRERNPLLFYSERGIQGGVAETRCSRLRLQFELP